MVAAEAVVRVASDPGPATQLITRLGGSVRTNDPSRRAGEDRRSAAGAMKSCFTRDRVA